VFAATSNSHSRQLARLIDFTRHYDVHLGCGNAAAIDLVNAQFRANAKSSDSLLEQRDRNSGIHQRAEEHIAADAGKAL
jgi:hypothetical protein